MPLDTDPAHPSIPGLRPLLPQGERHPPAPQGNPFLHSGRTQACSHRKTGGSGKGITTLHLGHDIERL